MVGTGGACNQPGTDLASGGFAGVVTPSGPRPPHWLRSYAKYTFASYHTRLDHRHRCFHFHSCCSTSDPGHLLRDLPNVLSSIVVRLRHLAPFPKVDVAVVDIYCSRLRRGRVSRSRAPVQFILAYFSSGYFCRKERIDLFNIMVAPSCLVGLRPDNDFF